MEENTADYSDVGNAGTYSFVKDITYFAKPSKARNNQ